jgi:hypothetical protein
MRARLFVCLLLGLTACTGSSTPPPAASGVASPSASVTGPPSSVPSAAPSPTPVSSPSPGAKPLVLAVADNKGGLALYAVPPGQHVAGLLRRFYAPPNRIVGQVSLSENAAPVVCAVWRDHDAEAEQSAPQLWCYPAGSSVGRLLSKDASYGVGVRADGGAVAWTERATNPDLVVADLDGNGAAKVRSRSRYAPNAPEGGLPEGLTDVDWFAPGRIAVTDIADSDEGKGLCFFDVGKPRPSGQMGFTPCLEPRPAEQRSGYAHFEQAVPVSDTDVIVVERARGCCDDNANAPGARAVRIRISDGAVLEVVATPRAGRDVVDISGSARAVVYTTAVDRDHELVVSLRWAGEAHGAPLTGLPADLIRVTAQP